MNNVQRVVLVVAGIVLLWALASPPTGGGGFADITNLSSRSIDFGVYAIHVALVLVAGAVAFLLAGRWKA